MTKKSMFEKEKMGTPYMIKDGKKVYMDQPKGVGKHYKPKYTKKK